MADRSSASLPLQLRPSRLDREAFIARFGDLYERSPWIAEAAWDLGLGPEADVRLFLMIELPSNVIEADRFIDAMARVLDRVDGDEASAAELLGISRKQLTAHLAD